MSEGAHSVKMQWTEMGLRRNMAVS